MSLSSALNIGYTGLATSQAAIQTTGNNIANVDNPNYTREKADLATLPSTQYSPTVSIGQGVEVADISRQIDTALQGRLNNAVSDDAAAQTTSNLLGQIQSSLNELSGNGLSSKFSTFFNAWSNLANKPQDSGLRQVVLQDGQAVADGFTGIQSQLSTLQATTNSQLASLTKTANGLAQQVADLNGQIQASGGNNNALADQRDAVIQQLAGLVNITTIPQSNGVVNVNLGSQPLVQGGTNLGLTTTQQTVDGQSVTSLNFKTNGGTANATSGQIGALLAAQQQIGNTFTQINNVAHGLIYELNSIHDSGQGTAGLTAVTSSNAVTDPTASLNDPNSGLKFSAQTGSFVVHVKQASTGLETSTLVQVSLNGNASDTTLTSLANQLNNISGLSASVQGGKLVVNSANGDTSFSFSQDTSGVLAQIGVNNFFTGSDATNIGVNQDLVQDPTKLAASQNGDPGDNTNAIAIAALQTKAVASFKGQSLNDVYQGVVNTVASATAAAATNATAADGVKSTLQTQKDALSGVSLDEETVNMLQQQRAYQGAAEYISTVNQMMTSLLNIL